MTNSTDLSAHTKYYRIKNISQYAHPQYPLIETYLVEADTRKRALEINFNYLADKFSGHSRLFRSPEVETISSQEFLEDTEYLNITSVSTTQEQLHEARDAIESVKRFYSVMINTATKELEAISNAR